MAYVTNDSTAFRRRIDRRSALRWSRPPESRYSDAGSGQSGGPRLGEQPSCLLPIPPPPLPTPPPAPPYRSLLKLLRWFSTADSSLSPPLNYCLLAGCSNSKRGTNNQSDVRDRGNIGAFSLCLCLKNNKIKTSLGVRWDGRMWQHR